MVTLSKEKGDQRAGIYYWEENEIGTRRGKKKSPNLGIKMKKSRGHVSVLSRSPERLLRSGEKNLWDVLNGCEHREEKRVHPRQTPRKGDKKPGGEGEANGGGGLP